MSQRRRCGRRSQVKKGRIFRIDAVLFHGSSTRRKAERSDTDMRATAKASVSGLNPTLNGRRLTGGRIRNKGLLSVLRLQLFHHALDFRETGVDGLFDFVLVAQVAGGLQLPILPES